ncbi:PLC-like phosphodiesterase [Sporodiniella umbellata]|nr:PLC-like phosphodiesterase [Sporodiniella umbellata]
MSSIDFQVPDVIAHRGFSSENPENTLISFENAIKAGTTALEMDIRLSKDNEIVMMHDTTLNRTTTGLGSVRDHDWKGDIDQLLTKDSQQPIPRLKDVLELMKTAEQYAIVDIKFDNPLEILDHLQVLLNEYNQLKPKLIIGIWNVEFMKKAKKLFPDYTLCFIGLSVSAARSHFIDTVDCLSLPFAALVDQDGHNFIKEVHERKKKVFTWTINDPLQMKSCVLLKVDGVIGDNVTSMLEHVHKPKLLKGDELESFIAEDTYLQSKRTKLYYYTMKKAMSVASWKCIGIY